MELVREFSRIGKQDVAIAGGKGASLGEMTQAGIPVPDGFVVLSSAFDEFIKGAGLDAEIDAILETVDNEKVHTVEEASEKIQALIIDSEISKETKEAITESFEELDSEYVAVRSSATSEDSASAAWAGQLNTYLNVTKSDLLESVKKCWASLFTPRAIFYRFEKELHGTDISVAVVVQKMVDSEESGIAFSVHPVTEDPNQLIIEAGFGLGEAIVSGQITPDSYVVDKKDWHIIDLKVNEQLKGMFRVEEGGNEWKELGEEGKKQVLDEEEIVELSKLIVKIEKHYGFPCDIEWAKEKGKFYITQSRPITTLAREEMNKNPIKEKVVLGNQDIDASFATIEMTWEGMRNKEIQNQVGVMLPEIYNEIIKGKTINGYVNPEKFKIFVDACSDKLLNDKSFIDLVLKNTEEICDKMILYAEDKISSVERIPLEDLPSILFEIRKLQADCAFWGMVVAFADVFGTITNKSLGIIKDKSSSKKSIHVYSQVLSTPSKKSLTENALNEIRKSNEEDSFLLKKFFWLNQGYIGRGLTLEQLQEAKCAKSDESGFGLSRQKASDELNLNEDEGYIFDLLSKMAYVKALRTDCRQYLNVLANQIVDRIGNKFGIESRYLETLIVDELAQLVNREIDFGDKFVSRYEHSLILHNEKEDYDFYVGKDAEDFLNEVVLKERKGDKNVLKGNVAYFGKVCGKVKLVFGPQHNFKVEEGDILVATATSPQLLPAMRKSAAFVTDVGGITSHAAIVAREMKKPCVVGTKMATQVLKDGDKVEVDANEGLVRLLNMPSEEIKTEGPNRTVLKELVHLDVPLALVELHYEKEAESNVPWADEPFTISPYIFYRRRNNLVYLYYDPEGIEWQMRNAGRYEDISGAINKIRSGFNKIKDVLKNESTLSEKDFLKFIKNVKSVWPWLNYMWWAVEDKERRGEPIEDLLEMRKYTEYFTPGLVAVIQNFIKSRFPNHKRYVKVISLSEAMNKRLPNENILERRLKGYAYTKCELYSSWNEVVKIYGVDVEDVNYSENLSGQTAYPGKVVGKVCIIQRREDLKKFKEGWIIVASTTTPDYLPAMKKAAAIVSEHGGAICHAAIISRELKIPCVIGTKNATRILKSGDKVEVDANRGIVKILERCR